ncbi:MAG: VOC family protein [Rhodopila sp.]|nr:VOC family protein [Rhodopila sp.]
MNTEITVHPKLHHYGLITSNMNTMINWYRTALGMTVNHQEAVPAEQQGHAPFAGMAFLSNDEADHRLVFFEVRDLVADPDKHRHPRLQHVAFACDTLDDLFGTYVRLKGLGIEPAWAADHGVGTAFYYEDPDQNVVEINVNNYGNAWTATEHMRTSAPITVAVDPEKMVTAREAGASPWEVHKRAVAGEFALTNRRVRS